MNKKVGNKLVLALTALLLASLACQSVGGGNPSPTTEESQAEPGAGMPTPDLGSNPTEEEPASTGGVYDGRWTGTNTVDDKEILFTVENNRVTSISLNVTAHAKLG